MTTALALVLDEASGVPTVEQFRQARTDGGYSTVVVAPETPGALALLQETNARDVGLIVLEPVAGKFNIVGIGRDICGIHCDVAEYELEQSGDVAVAAPAAPSVVADGPSPDLSNAQLALALALGVLGEDGCRLTWLGRRDGALVYELLVPEPLPLAVRETP